MKLEKLLKYFQTHPNSIEIVEIQEILMDSTRGNDKKPGILKIAVPDEIVKNLRGEPEKRDILLIMRIPNEIKKKMESPIIIL